MTGMVGGPSTNPPVGEIDIWIDSTNGINLRDSSGADTTITTVLKKLTYNATDLELASINSSPILIKASGTKSVIPETLMIEFLGVVSSVQTLSFSTSNSILTGSIDFSTLFTNPQKCRLSQNVSDNGTFFDSGMNNDIYLTADLDLVDASITPLGATITLFYYEY